MISIEKLTDGEREMLVDFPENIKALRIIDALTEALAAAERECLQHVRMFSEVRAGRLAAEARVRELEAENIELSRRPTIECASGTECELAALRERVEKFRGEGLDAMAHRMSESVCEDIDAALYEVLRGR